MNEQKLPRNVAYYKNQSMTGSLHILKRNKRGKIVLPIPGKAQELTKAQIDWFKNFKSKKAVKECLLEPSFATRGKLQKPSDSTDMLRHFSEPVKLDKPEDSNAQVNKELNAQAEEENIEKLEVSSRQFTPVPKNKLEKRLAKELKEIRKLEALVLADKSFEIPIARIKYGKCLCDGAIQYQNKNGEWKSCPYCVVGYNTKRFEYSRPTGWPQPLEVACPANAASELKKLEALWSPRAFPAKNFSADLPSRTAIQMIPEDQRIPGYLPAPELVPFLAGAINYGPRGILPKRETKHHQYIEEFGEDSQRIGNKESDTGGEHKDNLITVIEHLEHKRPAIKKIEKEKRPGLFFPEIYIEFVPPVESKKDDYYLKERTELGAEFRDELDDQAGLWPTPSLAELDEQQSRSLKNRIISNAQKTYLEKTYLGTRQVRDHNYWKILIQVYDSKSGEWFTFLEYDFEYDELTYSPEKSQGEKRFLKLLKLLQQEILAYDDIKKQRDLRIIEIEATKRKKHAINYTDWLTKNPDFTSGGGKTGEYEGKIYHKPSAAEPDHFGIPIHASYEIKERHHALYEAIQEMIPRILTNKQMQVWDTVNFWQSQRTAAKLLGVSQPYILKTYKRCRYLIQKETSKLGLRI